MDNNALMRPWPLLVALVLLNTGCAVSSPPSVLPSVAAPRVPKLPPQARQQPLPPECMPTCSASLERELSDLRSWLESTQGRLTGRMPPGSPASEAATR